MAQRYFTHLSMVSVAHLLLILGGFQLYRSDVIQHKFRNDAITMKIIDSVFIPAAKFAPAKPVVAKTPAVSVKPAVKPVQTTPSEVALVTSTAPAAANGVSNGTLNGVDNGIGAGSNGTKLAGLKDLFKAELRAKIDQNKSYPSMSKRLGQQGNVILAFTLLEDGTITDLHVVTASRFELLNKSAEEAVRKIKKFKPIPKELGLAKMDVKIPIRYSLTQ